jgi:hypothetical protein
MSSAKYGDFHAAIIQPGRKRRGVKQWVQPCPICAEAEEQMQVKEKKARELEQNAVTRYEAQATIIKQQIVDAGDDQELRDHPVKILENCKVLWAGKVRTAESKVENKPLDRPNSGSLVECWGSKIKCAPQRTTS